MFNLKRFVSPSAASTTKRHVERRVLRTPPLHLFQIIQDVDSYSEFLPLCHRSETIRESSDGRSFDARLTIGLGSMFSEDYVSRVTVVPERLRVSAASIQSKYLDHLASTWELSAIKDDSSETGVVCQVDFQVELGVSNPIIARTLESVMQEVAGRQMRAFENRCYETEISPEILETTKASLLYYEALH